MCCTALLQELESERLRDLDTADRSATEQQRKADIEVQRAREAQYAAEEEVRQLKNRVLVLEAELALYRHRSTSLVMTTDLLTSSDSKQVFVPKPRMLRLLLQTASTAMRL